MGLFSTSTPFDAEVEKITDEKNTSEDWGMIMDLCDRVQATTNGPRDCLKSITKRLQHQDPHVVIQAVTLLDACVNNCGKYFKLEVASREFENDFKKLLGRSHQKVQEKLTSMLKKWAENDFKGDSQLSLIPSLYANLKKEGIDFGSGSGPTRKTVPKDPNVVSSQQEEDDIAKAIQMSLAESKTAPTQAARSTLYPSASDTSASVVPSSTPATDQKKGRALYDFEAAEDNELTFKAGEIVIIADDSDANWWKGSNHRGEGLFPANFVTTDLDATPEVEDRKRRRSVQFNEEVEVKTVQQEMPPMVAEISEERIDNVLSMLNEADPTSPESDPPVLGVSEDQVNSMGPLIDTELESIDRRHAQLTRLSTELVDALNLYHQLMHDLPAMPAPGGYGIMQGAPMQSGYPYMPPQQVPAAAYPPPQSYPPADMMNGGPSSYQYPPSQGANVVASDHSYIAPPLNSTEAPPPPGYPISVAPTTASGPMPATPGGPPMDPNAQQYTSPHPQQQPANPNYVMNGSSPAPTSAPPMGANFQQVPPMN